MSDEELIDEMLAALKAARDRLRLYLQNPAKSETLHQIRRAIERAEQRRAQR